MAISSKGEGPTTFRQFVFGGGGGGSGLPGHPPPPPGSAPVVGGGGGGGEVFGKDASLAVDAGSH